MYVELLLLLMMKWKLFSKNELKKIYEYNEIHDTSTRNSNESTQLSIILLK